MKIPNPNKIMQLTVNYNSHTQMFVWTIYDGPDGIDEGRGGARTLGEVFEQVTIWRHNNAKQYF